MYRLEKTFRRVSLIRPERSRSHSEPSFRVPFSLVTTGHATAIFRVRDVPPSLRLVVEVEGPNAAAGHRPPSLASIRGAQFIGFVRVVVVDGHNGMISAAGKMYPVSDEAKRHNEFSDHGYRPTLQFFQPS